MGGEVLPVIPLSCLLAGEGRVSAHLESQGAGGGRVVDLATAPVSQWLTRRSLPFKKNPKWYIHPIIKFMIS
ncbi:hypothetical protein Hanom_Chr12g01085021 [Helianthus anomalus]